MSADPILVLQLQRMGDLILTFPLLLTLQKNYSEHPIWVVAEPQFFTPLMPLSPKVVFFPPSACVALAQKKFFLIINLSGRVEAGQCLDSAAAEKKYGLGTGKDASYVLGFWHLFRFGLTQNNHLNTFHWSDLYRLDSTPFGYHPLLSQQRIVKKSNRIALVLGASDDAKRPEASFWSALARNLAQNGLCPILIGGKAEAELGEYVARVARLPAANLCGKLRLDEVAVLFREAVLCITPDTGPMHLADWMGTKILNLSMGPVHAPETGPYSPYQWILRAKMSCIGCWQCTNSESYRCKTKFHANAVGGLAIALIGDTKNPENLCPKQLQLLQSSRDVYGLYQLKDTSQCHTCRTVLENFWRSAFLCFSGNIEFLSVKHDFAVLAKHYPASSRALVNSLKDFTQYCSHSFRHRTRIPEHFWYSCSPQLRFFAGHTQMYLQNANWSKSAWYTVMERLELLHKCVEED